MNRERATWPTLSIFFGIVVRMYYGDHAPPHAFGVTVMHRIVEAKPAPGFVLEVEFLDGTVGRIDLSQRLFGPMFEPLRDASVFNQVQIDEYGAICWPNGADLGPDALYEKIMRDATMPISRPAESAKKT